jgi:hypothetical protein
VTVVLQKANGAEAVRWLFPDSVPLAYSLSPLNALVGAVMSIAGVASALEPIAGNKRMTTGAAAAAAATSHLAPTGPPLQIVGPQPTTLPGRPTLVTVSVQQFDETIGTDLAWRDAPELATVTAESPGPNDVLRWTVRVTFAKLPSAGTCR